MHPESLARGFVPTIRDAAGRPGRIASHRHPLGDYLRAALAAGLELRACEEPRVAKEGPPVTVAEVLEKWEVWPWALAALVPEATRVADAGVPSIVVWHFQAP
ncbi:hypothetical protein ACIBG7_15980 [Nonomuraea sp. NPDC050328]|uniref:hypothetical protein n=1 Tax=Nonomuraea sp. NPDC050328 TaxID=3364361 RepID=UPI003789D3E3